MALFLDGGLMNSLVDESLNDTVRCRVERLPERW